MAQGFSPIPWSEFLLLFEGRWRAQGYSSNFLSSHKKWPLVVGYETPTQASILIKLTEA